MKDAKKDRLNRLDLNFFTDSHDRKRHDKYDEHKMLFDCPDLQLYLINLIYHAYYAACDHAYPLILDDLIVIMYGCGDIF